MHVGEGTGRGCELDLGFRRVFNLGGFKNACQAGFPVEPA